MDEELLTITPKRFLCPHCGEWHTWLPDGLSLPFQLGEFNSRGEAARLKCIKSSKNMCDIYFDFTLERCYYNIELHDKIYYNVYGSVKIADIEEGLEEPRATFKVNLSKFLQFEGGEITLGFEFDLSDYKSVSDKFNLACEERELNEFEEVLKNREKSLNSLKKELQEKEKSLQEYEKELQEKEKSLV